MLDNLIKDTNFEISKREYSDLGLQNFFWPISYAERRAFAEEYIVSVKDFFLNLSPDEKVDADVLLVLQSHLFVISTTIAQASLLREHTYGCHVTHPKDRSKCWSAESPLSWFKDYEKKLFSQLDEPKWKTYARYTKYLLRNDHLKALPLKYASKRYPIVTGKSPLLDLYLKNNNIKTVAYAPYSQWFYKLSSQEKACDNVFPISDIVLDKYMNCIPNIGTHKIDDDYILAFRKFIKSTSHTIKLYLHRFENNKDLIPEFFLSGSMGMFLNGIIALAVKRNGGKTIGFDHGYSCNIWSSSTTAFVETQITDEFYTFSTHSARAIEKKIEDHCFSSTPPKIQFYNTSGKSEVIKNIQANKTSQKTIMFVQALYIGDQGELDPIMPNVVAADWQVRLFNNLSKQGYKIILKPHPLSGTQIPHKILTDLNVEIRDEPFEDICMDADILMFDYALSTTFHLGMLTNKPMIYFHFSDSKYPSNLEEILHQRIEIVNGFYDKENRANIAWDLLSNHIKASQKKKSHKICEKVLPNFLYIKFQE